MAQYHNSRNYRRDEQRNVNEVVFRDGMPVTYSSRQERGGKRPEGGYNKGGKSFNRGNDRRERSRSRIIRTASRNRIIKSGTMPKAATTAPRRKIIIRQSARKPHIRPAISRRRTRRRRTRSRMSCPTL